MGGVWGIMGVRRQPAILAAFMRISRLGGPLVGRFQRCVLEIEEHFSQTVDLKEYQTCNIVVARWNTKNEQYVIGQRELESVVLDPGNYRVLLQIVSSGQYVIIDRRFSVREVEIDWFPDRGDTVASSQYR